MCKVGDHLKDDIKRAVTSHRRSALASKRTSGRHWCKVLQCVAVCCNVLQYVAVTPHKRGALTSKRTSAKHCCSVLQCVAVCCSVLQRVAVCCSNFTHARRSQLPMSACILRHTDITWDLTYRVFSPCDVCEISYVAECVAVCVAYRYHMGSHIPSIQPM